MRVIVCGSRDWGTIAGYQVIDEARITDILNKTYVLTQALNSPLIIVHGGCPTGADAIADRWARRRDLKVIVFEADWTNLRKAAGPIRNSNMALAGADMCLAFLRDRSRGTTDMIWKARGRNIPTYVIHWDQEAPDDDPEPPPAKPYPPLKTVQDPLLVQLHDERLEAA